ncbi:hypothetical protein BGX23_009229 [Mortierella sp. AD031]|nr:hypothetical protein BGX23_009229 [Mortierella sp. AD031]
MFKALTSGRLLYFELVDSRLGPLTFSCLRELYFSHLRELDFGRSNGVPTEMVQEILTECIHLVTLDAPHIFVRDIATASRPWGCLGIQKLVVFIAKQPEDEDGWDSRVFEQISKLRRLETLDLRRDPYLSFFDDEPRPDQILDLETLDLRLLAESGPNGCCSSGGHNIHCWSSFVQLREFSFDDDRQTLGLEEARWMTGHWRYLHLVRGEFKGDHDELDLLFRQKDIKLIT